MKLPLPDLSTEDMPACSVTNLDNHLSSAKVYLSSRKSCRSVAAQDFLSVQNQDESETDRAMLLLQPEFQKWTSVQRCTDAPPRRSQIIVLLLLSLQYGAHLRDDAAAAASSSSSPHHSSCSARATVLLLAVSVRSSSGADAVRRNQALCLPVEQRRIRSQRLQVFKTVDQCIVGKQSALCAAE